LEIQALLEQNIVAPLQTMINRKRLPSDTDSAAVVMENATGNVLAYVGTIQEESNYDNARRLVRSCGSVAKPFFYCGALEIGLVSPNEMIMDAPTCFPCPSCKDGVYCPHNYSDVYSNASIPLREALALSRNIPAIRVYRRLSRAQFDGVLEKLSLPRPTNYMTAPLGWEITPLDLASAYTVFGNGGHAVAPRFVTHTIVNGKKEERQIMRRPGVFGQPVCNWAIGAMRLCLTHGTGRAASATSGFLAGKTGSSDSAWSVLFGQSVSSVCWIGRRQTNIDMKQTGGKLSMPLLAGFFSKLRRIRPDLTQNWRDI
jgi:membrane peptidoglycan carboxypeptidase